MKKELQNTGTVLAVSVRNACFRGIFIRERLKKTERIIMNDLKKKALACHFMNGVPGKTEVVPAKPSFFNNQGYCRLDIM